MSEAIQCDNEGCRKFFLLDSDDSMESVHTVIHGDEPKDFCNIDCEIEYMQNYQRNEWVTRALDPETRGLLVVKGKRKRAKPGHTAHGFRILKPA